MLPLKTAGSCGLDYTQSPEEVFFQLLQKLPSLDRKMAKAFHQARISTVQLDKGNCPLTVICAAHV